MIGSDDQQGRTVAPSPGRDAQAAGPAQRQVAQAMGVTVGRVGQIENGEPAGIDVLNRCVSALGGDLQLVANFGDKQVELG